MVHIVDACCWLQGLVNARQTMQNAYSLHVHSFRTHRESCVALPSQQVQRLYDHESKRWYGKRGTGRYA